jgi:hypothetical protein
MAVESMVLVPMFFANECNSKIKCDTITKILNCLCTKNRTCGWSVLQIKRSDFAILGSEP